MCLVVNQFNQYKISRETQGCFCFGIFCVSPIVLFNIVILLIFFLQELDLLKEDANVYKLIGPVLVKQDLAEANANVRKRIEYISAEL